MSHTALEENSEAKSIPQSHSPKNSPRPPSAVTAAEACGWLLRYISAPLMFFIAGAALLGLLGLAQKTGWIIAGSVNVTSGSDVANADVDYICPMMCTPPQKEPGRCPVCAMELVPGSAGGAGGDERSVFVDPASRRVANIQTVSVRNVPAVRIIRTVGELRYDEGKLKTISSYSDGRFDKLYVDYTGAIVQKGKRLASFYSPELYSAQVEYLQAGNFMKERTTKTLAAVTTANRNLLQSARQRLIELGMSEEQIRILKDEDKARSRLDILSPMSGTVIEKMAIEGEYVKEGQPVFKLADLSNVWLMLELFPEEAASVRNDQVVTARLKSLPGHSFPGRVAFIDPDVNPKTRTVNVRVMLDNNDGLLRIGEYATAEISVPASAVDSGNGEQLAATATVVPRNAILMAADQSVVYVEEKPGIFALRRIITGAIVGNDVIVKRGLAEGEHVATNGNFLLDSQMQLAGNPSLIDPTRAPEPMEMFPGFDATMLAAIQMLPGEDRQPALDQVICPVTKFKLGSMGMPPKAMVDDQPVFLCCEGCRDALVKDPQGYVRILQAMKSEGTLFESADDGKDPSLPEFGPIQSIEQLEVAPPIGEIRALPRIEPIRPASNKKTVTHDESAEVRQ